MFVIAFCKFLEKYFICNAENTDSWELFSYQESSLYPLYKKDSCSYALNFLCKYFTEFTQHMSHSDALLENFINRCMFPRIIPVPLPAHCAYTENKQNKYYEALIS